MFRKQKTFTLPIEDNEIVVPNELLPDDVEVSFLVLGEETPGKVVEGGMLLGYSNNEEETVTILYDYEEKEDTVTPVVEAIKSIPETVIPEADYSSITSALKNVEDAIFATESDDQDLSPVVAALNEVKEAVDNKEIPEPVDVSRELLAIADRIPEATDLSEVVSSIRELIDSVEALPSPIPERLIKDNRVKVEVDRIGGGLSVSTKRLEDLLSTGVKIEAADSASIDAFSRLRTSEPVTLFDSKQLHDNQPLFWDDSEVSGSGTTSTHSTAKASTTIGVAGTTAGKRVRQTFMRFNYQPGKSQLLFLTGTLGASGGGAGITRAAGLFDDDNGIFMMDDEGTIKAVIRSSYTGSPVDNAVAQSDWNIDKLDGTGASGLTLDSTKSQIIVIDFEWLGVGRVRIGFVINGLVYFVHAFNHANLSAGVYMSTPNLPLRYEIENDGTGAASTLEHICATVISEGGQEDTGVLRAADSGAVSSLLNSGTYAVLGIKLKSTHLDASINLTNLAQIGSANDQYKWELILNPTVNGTFTYSGVTNSAVEIASGAATNTVSGGTVLANGFVNTNENVSERLDNAIRLGSDIAGNEDELVVAVSPITNNITVRAALTWRELN